MTAGNEFTRANLPAPLRDAGVEWGVVLGSGLGAFVERLAVRVSVACADIAGLLVPRVPGHAARIVLGTLAGVPVLVAQGRVHLYEGHPARDVAAGIRLLAACGVRRLVLTNAAGSANPAFAPGAWMLIADQLNLTGASPLAGGPHFCDMSEVYSARLRRHFARHAAALGIVLHEGVYAGLPGPQYETPAEVRMLQRLGADAVGMSTVLEAIQARALGIETVGLSCLTNWAAGLAPHPLDHQEVLATGRNAAAPLADLLAKSLAAPVAAG